MMKPLRVYGEEVLAYADALLDLRPRPALEMILRLFDLLYQSSI